MLSFITDRFKQYKENEENYKLARSRYVVAHEYYRFRISVRQALVSLAFVSLGIISAGFGLKGFLMPNKFIDGA